ncbi:MAG TPA: reactive intermediate/imine deaminase [Elusimicrobia bacterium]|nr:reactive intermediate/imine deaminase [Elusimicrobiota bacterium]
MLTQNEAVRTAEAPAAIGPYSQAVKAGEFLFVSGQLPADPKTGALVEGGVDAQTEQALKNLGGILQAAGLGFEHVVKTTVFMTDLSKFAQMNEVYARRFPKVPPARATVQVSALPKGAQVEIEAVARG